MISSIVLSIDVEEFDMPLEYGHSIPIEKQMEAGKKGLDALMPILEKHRIITTLFTTANFALTFSDSIASLSNKHEIASHTYFHSTFEYSHLLESKLVLEQITQKKITGLRMPRMKKINHHEIIKAGYTYDSSVHPTWIPGRYNNLHLPRTIFQKDSLTIVPASVTNPLRIPLFWLAFKNYPYAFFKNACIQILKKDGFLCLYFHPWEFIDLGEFNIPHYCKRIDGNALLDRLEKLIIDLAPYGNFCSISDHLSKRASV